MSEKQTSGSGGSVRPTKKQRDILTFIENFIREHGYSPSYREIMNGLDYNSVATVSLHINSLIRRGHLVKRDHSARSLEVVTDSGATAATVAATKVSSESKSASKGPLTKSAEELWLEDKIDQYVTRLTASGLISKNIIKLEIIYEAVKLLGIDALADDTAAKLSALQARADRG